MAKKIQPKDLGIQPAPAGISLPKIKKIKKSGLLNYVSPSDRDSRNLLREVDLTCLERDLKIRSEWKLDVLQMISPDPAVEARYREKRAELKDQGGNRLQHEVFGFYICRDRRLATDIARTGIKANPFVKGYLGDPSKGVYLFRYLDVALLSQRDRKNCAVLVFKVLQGRAKAISIRDQAIAMGELRDPTPNFDCHVSQSTPGTGEPVFALCNKSQMYIYEYTDDAEPSKYPRQCLPYALMEFSKTGDARTHGATSSLGHRMISTSAANAGWESTSRRPSIESSRKGGLEVGQSSRDYPGFAVPAPQPTSLPTAYSTPSDAEAASSFQSKESFRFGLGPAIRSEGEMWQDHLENSHHSSGVAMEMFSTQPDKSHSVPEGAEVPFDVEQDAPLPGDGYFERVDSVVGASSQFTERSMASVTSLHRLSVCSAGTSVYVPSPATGSGVGETGGQVENVSSLAHGQWARRDSAPNTAVLHPQEESNLSCHVSPAYGIDSVRELLHRKPMKSALKKPTDAYSTPFQTDSGKKKKTLSLQDYLKKKAEAQANSKVKEAKPPSQTAHEAPSSSWSSQEWTPAKQSFVSKRDEFQGCDYQPPEISEQYETSVRLADRDSFIPFEDTVTDSCEQRTLSENPKPVVRDPRLRISDSSVYSQIAKNKMSEKLRMLSSPDGVTLQDSSSVEVNKSKSTSESSQKLSCDSQRIVNDTQDKTTCSEPRKESSIEDEEQKSESGLMEATNHQVLFADLDETENENALSMHLDDISPSEYSPEGWNNSADPAAETDPEQTDFHARAGMIVDVTGHCVNQGLSSAVSPSGVDQLSESNQGALEEEDCEQKLSLSPDESLSEEVASVIKPELAHQLPVLAKGLLKSFALVTSRKAGNQTETPGSDSSFVNNSKCILSSESSPSQPGLSNSSKQAAQGCSSEDVTVNSTNDTETSQESKPADGNKQKSKGKGRGKPMKTEGSEPVDYALLRLAKGLRPGKSIEVGGLGKNPTDDPLPILEGKRRGKKNNQESKTKVQKVSQPMVTIEKGPQQCKRGKKPRKKKLTRGRRRAKRQPAPAVLSWPPDDDEGGCTHVSSDQPQMLSASLSSDMAVAGCDSAQAHCPEKCAASAKMREQSAAAKPAVRSSPCGSGRALPLSSLKLHHWTEAFFIPSLNPQVVLVDLCKALGHINLEEDAFLITGKDKGEADLDKDAEHLEVHPSLATENNVPLAAGTTHAHGSETTTSVSQHPASPTLFSGDGGESEGTEEGLSGNDSWSQETEHPQTGVENCAEEKESKSFPMETEGTGEGDTKAAQTQPMPVDISSSSMPDVTMEPVIPAACDSAVTDSLLNTDQLSAGTLQRNEAPQTVSSPSHGGEMQTPFGQLVASSAVSRPASIVRSQSSTRQNWQRWKSSQAEQVQLKTTKELENSQKQASVSCVESGAAEQSISSSHLDADTDSKVDSQNSSMKDSEKNNDHRNHEELSKMVPVPDRDAQKTTTTASSSISVQNGERGGQQHSGFWLGISELTSLQQSDKDSRTDMFSCSASKISPTKLSWLAQGNEAPSSMNYYSSPCLKEVTCVDSAHQSCFANSSVGLSEKSTTVEISDVTQGEDVGSRIPESRVNLEATHVVIGSGPSQRKSNQSSISPQDALSKGHTKKQASGSTQVDKLESSTKQNDKQARSELWQSVAVPSEKKTDIFDIAIKVSHNQARQPYSSIPGLDLLSPTKAEVASFTDSKRDPRQAAENMGALSADSQQSGEWDDGFDIQGEGVEDTSHDFVELRMCAESKEADKENGKISENGKEWSTETSELGDLNLSYSSADTFLNEELDIVGTHGASRQTQNIENKKKLFSFVSQSLQQKKENAHKGGTRCTDGDKSSSDLQSNEKNDTKAVERNVLEVGDENAKSGRGTPGLPIPSFTRARSYQKSDWKDMKKQLGASKGSTSSVESPRNAQTKPAFQTEAFTPPHPPRIDEDGDSKPTRSDHFCKNAPLGQFHSDLAYGTPVHQQTLGANRLMSGSMPLPNMLMPNIHMSSVAGPAAVHPMNAQVFSESGRPCPPDPVQPIPYAGPVAPSLFTTLPPLLPPVVPPPAPVQMAAPLTEVSSVTASASQTCSASSQLHVSATDVSTDRAGILQTVASLAPPVSSGPSVETQNAVDGSRDHAVKTSEMDVISWFAQREAAEKNPPKKDVIDWFADIIDKKKNASPMPDLELEMKKVKAEFIESLSQKKSSMHESKEKAFDSPSRTSKKFNSCESRDAGNKDSLKRQSSSSSSRDASGNKKFKSDKVAFKVGLSSAGVTSKLRPVLKQVDLGWLSDSEESDQKSIEHKSTSDSEKSKSTSSEKRSSTSSEKSKSTSSEKSRSTSSEKSKSTSSEKSKSTSSEVHGKNTESKKDAREPDTDKASKGKDDKTEDTEKGLLQGLPQSGKRPSSAGEKPVPPPEKRRRLHSRWDQKGLLSKKSPGLHDASSHNDTDDDMNDYAHALLEGDSSVNTLETISNRISASILKSVSSTPKSSKPCDKSSNLQKSSAVSEKIPCDQKEDMSGKNKSNLTDKPLEFLLFAKEMIMQKLQEEEGPDQVVTEPDQVDSNSPSHKDPVSCQEKRLPCKSGDGPSKKKDAERGSSDLEGVKNKKEEKIDPSRKERKGACPASHTTQSCAPSSTTAEAVGKQKGIVRGSCASAGTEGKAARSLSSQDIVERKATTSATETQKKSEVTEEEINELENIMFRLSRRYASNSSDRLPAASQASTSAKRKGLCTIPVLSTRADVARAEPSLSGNEPAVESCSRPLDSYDSAHLRHVYTDDKPAAGPNVVLPETCTTKAKNTAQVQALQVSSSDKIKESLKSKPKAASPTCDGKASSQQKGSAAVQRSTSGQKEGDSTHMSAFSAVTSGPGSHCGTGSKDTLHRNPETKTLKDFLLENFPDHDPVLLGQVLEDKLSTDLSTLSNKTKSEILLRIRSFMGSSYSGPSSSVKASLSVAQQGIPLEELGVEKIKIELGVIEGLLALLRYQSKPDQDESGLAGQSLRAGMSKEHSVKVIDALSVVVQDFTHAIAEAERGWKGRPHQRIPSELLLRDEQDKLYTMESNMTILSAALPCRPYARLLKLKEDIEECLIRKHKAALANQTRVLMQEKQLLEDLRRDRHQLLITFTGAPTSNRLRKVAVLGDHYAEAQQLLLRALGDEGITNMCFFTSTYRAIQNHLQILQSEVLQK